MENGAFCLSKSDKVMGVRLSTNTKEYGAISVFYPGVLQRLAQLMGSDLYILFTSGNESKIYSANESNLEDIKTELNEMVIEYRKWCLSVGMVWCLKKNYCQKNSTTIAESKIRFLYIWKK